MALIYRKVRENNGEPSLIERLSDKILLADSFSSGGYGLMIGLQYYPGFLLQEFESEAIKNNIDPSKVYEGFIKTVLNQVIPQRYEDFKNLIQVDEIDTYFFMASKILDDQKLTDESVVYVSDLVNLARRNSARYKIDIRENLERLMGDVSRLKNSPYYSRLAKFSQSKLEKHL
ncbi:MAG: hypothetical protein AABW41_05330 [Nanoarchaeota archaeon]